MKAQKKDTKAEVEKAFGLNLTLNEDLNKYSGPEFAPPKLKDIEEKFRKQTVFKAKQTAHH